MMKPFNPADWYWIVANDETKLYSSKVNDYVLPTDPVFIAWRDDPVFEPSVPSRITNEADLGEVLAPYFLRPTRNGILQAYLSAQADKIDKVQFKIMFFLLNEIRGLKGQQALTVPQAVAAIRSML